MKIEQGYTLSQFVDHCETQTAIEMAISYMDIVKYNNILKQPLSKEMFVNGVEKVDGKPPFIKGEDHHNYFMWRAAEKKVIFENVIVTKNESCCFSTIFVNYDGRKIKIANDFNSEVIFAFNTISDLFDYTKGQLKLKNVEL